MNPSPPLGPDGNGEVKPSRVSDFTVNLLVGNDRLTARIMGNGGDHHASEVRLFDEFANRGTRSLPGGLPSRGSIDSWIDVLHGLALTGFVELFQA
jgi:hypothetical protein